MNKASVASLVLVFAAVSGALSAQKGEDVIRLRDGTVLRNVKVLSWTAKEIRFKSGRSTESRSAHEVRKVTIAKVQQALIRVGDKPSDLVGLADTTKDPLIAQAALFRAAKLFREDGKNVDSLAAMQRIDERYPNSAYAPRYYQSKIRYYLFKKKPSDARKVAEKYSSASITRGWSRAYRHDAEYWERKIAAVSKKIQATRFVSELKDLMGRAEGEAPFVVQAAAADLADTYRSAGVKKYKEARAEYERLRGQKGLDPDVRARVYLGLGYLSLEDAVASKSKDNFHKAFKNFLMVFINAKDAHPELVAEGLYRAAKVSVQWNGLAVCGQMAGRLRGRLKLRDPWKHTTWASKK